MAAEQTDEQAGHGQVSESSPAGGAGQESAAAFGQRMAASEEQSERYADIEDTNREDGDSSRDDAETANTPNSVTAFAQNSRHD